ncbi:hypothetical protein JAB6_21190 [Janthinobacterium sp. HH104]|uniref:Uncharacterized protein n=1 Tax=Janthinobacterium lividum TaxID=29581 RepID=A0AB38C504_9BURK|nr:MULTISPECIES: hypothetical protein [Janthinobacterium]OEZ85270.1 hypothetical protein JAB6_21190 [Janthinobacterium sp. HH104]SFX29399.1 hypothetical protein SAMN03097694_1499 [Janthinobacterium lividum]
MQLDEFVKIGMFVLGFITATKVLYDLFTVKWNRLREDYNFSKKFLEDVENFPGMHPYALEKGYQALAGTTILTVEEVSYLLTVKEAPQALKNFVLGRPYLQLSKSSGNNKIVFKDKFCSNLSRNWRKAWYLTIYIVTAFIAYAPILFSQEILKKTSVGTTISLAVLSALVFGYYAWGALKAGSRIISAEKLVKNQEKHTQRIILEKPVKVVKKS